MIELKNVSKTFRRVKVLDGLDLAIGKGERVALVGSNGAGKTTLIRCLLGEYVCDGSVTVGGLAPRSNRRVVLSRIGFVPQLPPPLKMPVGQLIRWAASLCSTDPAKMEEVATRLGLDVAKFRRHQFVKLSGGQKQKLLISIALGRDSDILVMDEPAANLEPKARGVFFELLAERKDRSVMLMSSHRLDEVASLVNRVIELDRGKITLDDRVADDVAMTSVMTCRLMLSRAEPAIAKTLIEWRFTDMNSGKKWEGIIAGPDRLRFMGMLSRYAGLVASVTLEETERTKV